MRSRRKSLATREFIGGSGNSALWLSEETQRVLKQLEVKGTHIRRDLFGIHVIVTDVVPKNEMWLVSLAKGHPMLIKKFVVVE